MTDFDRIGPVLGAALAGAVVAGSVAGALIGLRFGIGLAILGVLVGWFVAALHAFVLGVPAYLIAGRPQLSRWRAALAGAGILVMPALLQTLPGLPASSGDWLILGELAIGGALGGLTFRTVLGGLGPA